MLFRQLFRGAIRSTTVKKRILVLLRLKYFFHTAAACKAWFHRWDTERIFFIGERRPPPRCEWRDCQIRIATASAQVWYFVCWIKNSSHPIFSEKNIWQVIICVKQAICCGDIYLFFADLSCAHLIHSYFDMHCKCHRCDRGAKGGPPYMMWLQELHALHT